MYIPPWVYPPKSDPPDFGIWKHLTWECSVCKKTVKEWSFSTGLRTGKQTVGMKCECGEREHVFREDWAA